MGMRTKVDVSTIDKFIILNEWFRSVDGNLHTTFWQKKKLTPQNIVYI